MKKQKNKKYGKGGDVGKVRKILLCFIMSSLLLCASACGSKETIQLQEDDMVLLEESGAENESLSEEERSTEEARSADEEDSTKTEQETTEETDEPVQEQVEESTLFVHICGEVIRPGVYELPEGSRVYEAVEAAGGFTAEAAESYVNLAQVLEDGKKIRIPDMQWVSEQEEANPAALQEETIREETAREKQNRMGW